MEKRERIYEGKAKIVYGTDDPDLIIQYFKDDTTAFNAAKRGMVANKGINAFILYICNLLNRCFN